MNTRRLKASLVALGVLVTVPVIAHHGTSITYEMDKLITVTGTATEFDFSYPHPALFMDVKDDKGKVVKWGAEFLPTPAALKALGWNRETIKFGDAVVLGCHPSKTGNPVCALQTITINGKATPLGGGPGGPPAAPPGGGQRGGRQ
jgi:hypothetical protein